MGFWGVCGGVLLGETSIDGTVDLRGAVNQVEGRCESGGICSLLLSSMQQVVKV